MRISLIEKIAYFGKLTKFQNNFWPNGLVTLMHFCRIWTSNRAPCVRIRLFATNIFFHNFLAKLITVILTKNERFETFLQLKSIFCSYQVYCRKNDHCSGRIRTHGTHCPKIRSPIWAGVPVHLIIQQIKKTLCSRYLYHFIEAKFHVT